jgi:hypothetical protein
LLAGDSTVCVGACDRHRKRREKKKKKQQRTANKTRVEVAARARGGVFE